MGTKNGLYRFKKGNPNVVDTKNLCCGDPTVCGHCVYPSETDTNYPARAKVLVQRVILSTMDQNGPFPTFDVEIVKFEKILQHWRAVVVATGPGEGKYYEVTYNGDTMSATVDAYEKTKTFAIADKSPSEPSRWWRSAAEASIPNPVNPEQAGYLRKGETTNSKESIRQRAYAYGKDIKNQEHNGNIGEAKRIRKEWVKYYNGLSKTAEREIALQGYKTAWR